MRPFQQQPLQQGGVGQVGQVQQLQQQPLLGTPNASGIPSPLVVTPSGRGVSMSSMSAGHVMMSPSLPGQNLPFPVAAPRSSRVGRAMKGAAGGPLVGQSVAQLPQGSPAKSAKYQFHPNLSGSETDVSTSTENLTQEERYLLRHMEREEPQGEENGDPMAAAAALHRFGINHAEVGGGGRASASFGGGSAGDILTSQAQQLSLAMAQRHHQLAVAQLSNNIPGFTSGGGEQGQNATNSGSQHSTVALAVTTRLATPVATPPTYTTPRGGTGTGWVDFPGGAAARGLQDEIWAAKMAAVGRSAGAAAASPDAVNASVSFMSSKLNPSVYSHPMSMPDPVLMTGGGPKNFYPLSVLSGRRENVDTTSSGAFFDARAVNPEVRRERQTDMISQLTREMGLAQLSDPELSGGGGNGSNSQLMSEASTSAATTASQSREVGGPSHSSPAKSTNSRTSETEVPANSTSLTVVTSAAGNRTTSISSSSGYRSDNSVSSESKELAAISSQAQAFADRQRHRNNAANANLSVPGVSTSVDGAKSGASKKAHSQLSLLSRSQPDLLSAQQQKQLDDNHDATPTNGTPDGHLIGAITPTREVAKTIDRLQAENRELRNELEEMSRRVNRVGSLEQEVAKIHAAYQSLLKHSEKREALEKAARHKLQAVIVNLTEVNKELTDRHESVMAQLVSGDPKNQNIPGLDTILRGEIVRKDNLIGQLMNQNKMLMAAKERQDVEVRAQQETLEDQRSHIQILDTALSNAQSQLLRLEEENRLKDTYAERVKQMTRSLEQLQAASEKREAMEKKLRMKLEEELRELRESAEEKERKGGISRKSDSAEIRRKLSQAEEKIIRLESEKTQWEQRYLEESAMRQVAIDAASIPKDAKIAALEKTSAESEKLIAEARSDKMRSFEEMQESQRRLAEQEDVIKSQETAIAELTAMLAIAQTNQTLTSTAAAAGTTGDLNTSAAQHQLNLLRQQQQQGSNSGGPLSLFLSSPMTSSSHMKQLSVPTAASSYLTPVAAAAAASPLIGDASSPLLRQQQRSFGGSSGGALVPAALTSAGGRGGLGLSSTLPAPLELLRADHSLLSSSSRTSDSHHLPQHHKLLALRRSATPTAELLRRSATTPTAVNNTARRDSAPGDVLAMAATAAAAAATTHPGSTLINTADLYHHQTSPPLTSSANSLSLVGSTALLLSARPAIAPSGTSSGVSGLLRRGVSPQRNLQGVSNPPQPATASAGGSGSTRGREGAKAGVPGSKIPMASLRDNALNRSTSKYSGDGGNNQNCTVDDSIDSIMGPMSSTHIDGSSHNSTFSQNYDSSKAYMEVWRV